MGCYLDLAGPTSTMRVATLFYRDKKISKTLALDLGYKLPTQVEKEHPVIHGWKQVSNIIWKN